MASRRDKPLGGYVRVSRVGDREETLISPDQQTDRIQGYATAHDLTVEMAEPELDVSGGTTTRPILDSLIARVESGELGGIIVAQLDRFSRMRIGDALQTIERIEAAGGRVVAVAEAFDNETPEGRLARNMFLSIAQMQLDRYRAGFASAKERALREGIFSAPHVPIGYSCTRRKDGGTGKLEVDPKAARRVRQAFEARARGASWVEVAEILERNEAGASKILRNRVYLGELHVGEMTPNLNAHPPLVSRELWEAAQIDHPRPPRSGKKRPALLAGIARCATCSRAMAATGSGYRCRVLHGRHRCPKPASISGKVDAIVEEAVLAKMKDVKVEAIANTEELEDAKRILGDAEAELAAFIDATEAAAIDRELLVEGLRARSDAVDDARRKVGELQAAGGTNDLTSLFAEWPEMTVQEKRHLLRASIGAVWVRPGKRDFANRIKICDTVDLEVRRGTDAPICTVVWDDLPVSVGIPSGEDL